MTATFTICSNNFLARAKTVLDSVRHHHPEMKTILFVIDEDDPAIDYGFFLPAEVVMVDEKVIPGFMELVHQYTVMELNTAVRPFIIRHLQGHYPGIDKLYYVDPDMYVYDRLDRLDTLLDEEDIIITPHFTNPIPVDGLRPLENLALNFGIYNAGVFAMNPQTANVNNFLDWWGERMRQFGHIDLLHGYFSDQIWFNLVPLFFKRVHILTHPGYNMAIWNLHERGIKSYDYDGRITLNSGDNLVIYHFSSWDYFNPGQLSREHNRYDFTNRPDLVKLYADYHQALIKNKVELFYPMPCRLPYNKKIVKRSPVQKILLPIVDLMRTVWKKL